MEKICIECGKKFTTKHEDIICRKCLADILKQESGGSNQDEKKTTIKKDDVDVYFDVTQPRSRKKPQIVIDAKRALLLGISYGEYMSKKLYYERKAVEMEGKKKKR